VNSFFEKCCIMKLFKRFPGMKIFGTWLKLHIASKHPAILFKVTRSLFGQHASENSKPASGSLHMKALLRWGWFWFYHWTGYSLMSLNKNNRKYRYRSKPSHRMQFLKWVPVRDSLIKLTASSMTTFQNKGYRNGLPILQLLTWPPVIKIRSMEGILHHY
jgi:hypothetical protein